MERLGLSKKYTDKDRQYQINNAVTEFCTGLFILKARLS